MIKKILLSSILFLTTFVFARAEVGDGFRVGNFHYQVTSVGSENTVEIVGYVGSKYVKNIVIPSKVRRSGVRYRVTSIGEIELSDCYYLSSLTIPSSVDWIEYNDFYSCNSLASFKVASNNPNYTSDDGVLFNKDKTILICYPKGKKNKNYIIPSTVERIQWDAFSGCRALTSVYIPHSVTTIAESAFNDCSGLTSITIPYSVTIIGDYAFYQCRSLTSIIIPHSVRKIGASLFENCTSLISVTIPSSVTSIESRAFQNCSSLRQIVSYVVEPQNVKIASNAFYNVPNSCRLIVPKGRRREYKIATQWNHFSNVKTNDLEDEV